MSKRQSVMFGDWSKGDYGRRLPATEPGAFRGLNVMVYPDGSVGPRPPMRPFPVTGYGTAEIRHAIWVTAGVYSLVESIVTVDIGGVVRGFDVDGRTGDTPTGSGATTNPGTVTSLSGLVEFNNQLFGVRFTAGGVQISSSAITSVAAMPSGQTAVAYGDQMVILRDSGSGPLNEIRWSAPADATSWPTANFLRVGGGSFIKLMRVGRNSLVFGLEDGTWWVLTGPLGPSAVLRRVDKSLPITILLPAASNIDRHPATVTNGGSVVLVTRRDVCTFTGAQTLVEPSVDSPYHALDVLNYPTIVKSAAPLLGDDQLAMSSYTSPNPVATTTIGTIVANPNDAWVRWQVPETLNTTDPGVAVLGDGSGILFVMTQAILPDAAPKFYTVNTQARSPLNSGAYSSATDTTITPVTPTDGNTGAAVQGTLRTYTWYHPEMKNTTVVGVVVDLLYEASHLPGGNVGLSVAVESVSSNTDTDYSTSLTQAWGPNQPKLSSTGTNVNPSRAIFRFGDQGPGPGFRLVFTNMKGCTIRQVMAIVDVDDDVRL